jgi:hypothetical protein
MSTNSDRNIQLGLMLKRSERDALTEYARANRYPTVSAAIRAALPDVFREQVREGRPLGYSPKRQIG